MRLNLSSFPFVACLDSLGGFSDEALGSVVFDGIVDHECNVKVNLRQCWMCLELRLDQAEITSFVGVDTGNSQKDRE